MAESFIRTSEVSKLLPYEVCVSDVIDYDYNTGKAKVVDVLVLAAFRRYEDAIAFRRMR